MAYLGAKRRCSSSQPGEQQCGGTGGSRVAQSYTNQAQALQQLLSSRRSCTWFGYP